MALIDCPECATQVSSAAVNCPKCGFPIAEEVKKTLGKSDNWATVRDWYDKEVEPQYRAMEPDPQESQREQAKRRDRGRLAGLVIVLIVGAALVDRYGRREASDVAPVATVHEVPRGDSQAWCRAVAQRLAPDMRKVLGVSTVAVQVGLLKTMSCKGTPEGFSCVYESGSPFELRVSDRDKVRGFRFKFTEEPVQGIAAPGCCDGVAEAAERYRRAKFRRYGRDCSLTFGRFPP